MNVLSKPSSYYVTNFSRSTSLMDEYRMNMTTYLSKLYPHLSAVELKTRLDKVIASTYRPTNVQYLEMESPGNIEVKSNLLLDVTNKLDYGCISPYGAVYTPVDERVSMFTNYISDNQAERKKVKHEELIAEASGDMATKQFKYLRQLNIKGRINILSGVMLSSVAFRSSVNYNAITSTARLGIMTSYAITEIALEGNYYFDSEDRAINWIVRLLRIFPGDRQITDCITKYSLHIPTQTEVYDSYVDQLRQYNKADKYPQLYKLINGLTECECTFVYYAANLSRLFRENDSFRAFFKYLINVDNLQNIDGDVPLITTLTDGDIRTLAIVCISDEIPDKCTVDHIANEMPDLNRRVYSVYMHLESTLDRLSLLFDTFILIPILPADIRSHKHMIRRTVLLSDTDSVLFTNVHWIKWFTGDIRITPDSTRINAAMVTLVSRILEHSLAYLSTNMGVSEDNLKVMAMKNEFMYDIFMRTPIAKHYAGYIRYREGMRLTPCKLDLKGKNLRGSDLPATTTGYVKKFIKDTFDEFLEDYKLSPDKLMRKIIKFEQLIRLSILDGEVKFLAQKPINQKSSYKAPESSAYLYYTLWTEVFADKYGELHLPQKCKEVYIKPVSVKRITPLDHMKVVDDEIYNRFIGFLKKWPKREFSRVMIPIDMTIPAELIEISDYSRVIKANCYSLELVLKAFNIVNFPTKHGINLFSDTYPELLTEVLKEIEYERASGQPDGYEDDEDDEFSDWEIIGESDDEEASDSEW